MLGQSFTISDGKYKTKKTEDVAVELQIGAEISNTTLRVKGDMENNRHVLYKNMQKLAMGLCNSCSPTPALQLLLFNCVS